MNSSLCLFLFIALFTCGKVLAKENVLATITNDDNKEVYTFVAQIDDETDKIKAFFRDEYIDGKKTERALLESKELTSNGLTLMKSGEHEVISLKSQNFDQYQGGEITIDTLYNGISGDRKSYNLDLAKADAGWKLFNGEKAISKLHIIVNKKMLIGAIGVKDIQMK